MSNEFQPGKIRRFRTVAVLGAATDMREGDLAYAEDSGTFFIYAGGAFKQLPEAPVGGELIRTVKVSLTAAEIKAMETTPKVVVVAQGANKVIEFVSAWARLNDDGTDYDDAAAQGDLAFAYVDESGTVVSGVVDADGFIDATEERHCTFVPASVASATVAQAENVALVFFNDGDAFTTGTRTMDVWVSYRMHDVS